MSGGAPPPYPGGSGGAQYNSGLEYSAPVYQSTGYGAPGPQPIGFGTPGTGAPGYGPPAPQAYGAPGYGAAVAPGYGAPGPQAPGYGAPGPHAPGYGFPGPQAPGYGAQGNPGQVARSESVTEIPDNLTFDDIKPFLGGFHDKAIRMGFIRKVYGILTAQLVVTVAIMCVFLFTEKIENYVLQADNMWVFWTAFGLTIACMLTLICCGNIRKRYPHNIIFLGIFTICEGVLLGIVSLTYERQLVLIAAGITCVVVLGLTVFAFQTKYDFTTCGGFLFVTLLVFICFGFLMIWFSNEVTRMIYAALGALIFCLYLVFDTQLMIGGKHQYSVSPEEYIMAALNLYLDIINIFLYILMLLGGGKK